MTHPATGAPVRTPLAFWRTAAAIGQLSRQSRPADGGIRYMARVAGVAAGTWIKYARLGAEFGMWEIEHRPGAGSGSLTNLYRPLPSPYWRAFPARQANSKFDTYVCKPAEKSISVKQAKSCSVTGTHALAPKPKSITVELTQETKPAESEVESFSRRIFTDCRVMVDQAIALVVLWQLFALGFRTKPAVLRFLGSVGRVNRQILNPAGFWRYAVANFVSAQKLNSATCAAGGASGGLSAFGASVRHDGPRCASDASNGAPPYGSSGTAQYLLPKSLHTCPLPEAEGSPGEPAPVPAMLDEPPDVRPDYAAGLRDRGLDPAQVVAWLGPERIAILGAIRTDSDIDRLAARYQARRRPPAIAAMRAQAAAEGPAPGCKVCADRGLCGFTERDLAERAEVLLAIELDGCWCCSCKAGRALEEWVKG